MPDFIFDTDTQIPEELRATATKNSEGKFILNLVPKAKLDEFRENNIKVAKERDDLKTKWDKVAPVVGEDVSKFEETFKTLQSTAQQVADGKLKTSADIDKVIVERTNEMRSSFEKKSQDDAKRIAELTGVNGSLKAELSKVHIDRQLTVAVMDEKSGARTDALPHILTEAYKVFHVQEDGSLLPKAGEAIIYGSDGATAMTPTEWLGKLKEKFPYLFKNSSGGGASGGTDKRFGGLKKEDFDKLKPSQKLALANKMQKAS